MPVCCDLRCAHRRLGPAQCRLDLVSAATSSDDDAAWEPVPEVSDDDAQLTLIIEYLRVPTSTVDFHPESQLLDMRPLGFADWNDTFDLVLLVNDFEGWPTEPLWEHVHRLVDKAGAMRVHERRPPRRGAAVSEWPR